MLPAMGPPAALWRHAPAQSTALLSSAELAQDGARRSFRFPGRLVGHRKVEQHAGTELVSTSPLEKRRYEQEYWRVSVAY